MGDDHGFPTGFSATARGFLKDLRAMCSIPAMTHGKVSNMARRKSTRLMLLPAKLQEAPEHWRPLAVFIGLRTIDLVLFQADQADELYPGYFLLLLAVLYWI